HRGNGRTANSSSLVFSVLVSNDISNLIVPLVTARTVHQPAIDRRIALLHWYGVLLAASASYGIHSALTCTWLCHLETLGILRTQEKQKIRGEMGAYKSKRSVDKMN